MRQVVASIRQWLGAPTDTSMEGGVEGSRSATDGGQVTAVEGRPATERVALSDSPSREEVFIETGMTPEEYLLSGLERNGGRLRQQEICEKTGWSEPTVSRLLTEMEADDLIVRYRLGRENLVCLPEHEL
jgi:uncharacterized membrane protein